MPLESKYWKLEKDLQKTKTNKTKNKIDPPKPVKCLNKKHHGQMFYLQFMAANSFKYSALYTRPTVKRGHTWKVIYNKYNSKDIIESYHV